MDALKIIKFYSYCLQLSGSTLGRLFPQTKLASSYCLGCEKSMPGVDTDN